MSTIEIIGGPPIASVEAIRRQIVDYLSGTPVLRAVLFGSFARGAADSSSDLDLMLIERSSRPFLDRGLDHLPLFRLGVGVDLLVYTPEEYAQLKAEGNPLIKRVEQEGVTLYVRYPNGLVEGTPHSAFTRSQAERALTAADTVLTTVREELTT